MVVGRPPLINGEIYHIVVRAIGTLVLFQDKKDYLRMLSTLLLFNNEQAVEYIFRKRFGDSDFLISDLGKWARILNRKREPEVLVEILVFCLMPNHIHLLVKQVREGGISKFMHKVGTGYAMYYNRKYERRGHVFQGKYRIVHVRTNEQLKTAFVYIHTNPVSLIVPRWREKGIKDVKKVIEFLENYKWSSYPDFLGDRNFPFLTKREFLIETIGGVEGCRQFVNGWLRFKQELADFGEIAIE